MSKRHFSGLLIAVIAAVVVIALLVPGRTDRDQQQQSGLLFPELDQQVNDADSLVITVAGGEVTTHLVRDQTQWTVSEMQGYPAHWQNVQAVLAAMARARIIEAKTSNPDYYERLGVEDIQLETATGTLVTLGVGNEQFELILGSSATNRNGRYARLPGSDASMLIGFDVDVPTLAMDWVDDQVADISADQVAEVVVNHPGAGPLRLFKASGDDPDFEVDGLPAGREIVSSWAVNSMGGILTGLRLEAAVSDDQLDWSGAGQIRLLTFSGMQVTIDMVDSGEGSWIRLHASQYGSGNDVEPATAVEEQADSDIKTAVELFNQRVSGWAYRVPDSKAELMKKDMEAIMKPLDEEAPAT